MPSSSPIPLALAREAEEEALKALCQAEYDLGMWRAGDGHPMPDTCDAERRFRAAQRAHREALVEATLRWATTMDAYIEQEGSAVVALGLDCEEFTVAEVLKTIEEANHA